MNYKLTEQEIQKLNLNQEIGNGIHGYVYSTTNSNLCVKVSTLSINNFNSFNDLDNKYSIIESNINYLIKNNLEPFVHVVDFNLFKISSNENIIYYYTMEKCDKISEDEYKVFHSLISHEDLNKIKDLSLNKINDIIIGLSKGLDFNVEHVKLFCVSILNSKMKHLDLHPRNIMKNKNGYFKLIDLDNLKLEN